MKRASGPLSVEERGPVFEGLVAQLIRAYRDYRGLCADIYYWAPSGSAATEVDFLLERGGEFVAVEVKSGKMFNETWCKGFRAIQPLKGLSRRIVVYPEGPALETEDHIEVLPFKLFADMLAGDAL